MKKRIESQPAPKAKIEPKPKLPEAFKGKSRRGAQTGRSSARPAGGGRKGY